MIELTGSVEPNKQKERYGVAYIHAVAALSGFLSHEPPDIDSVDITISSPGKTWRYSKPTLDVQSKCTERARDLGDRIAFDLEIKNYNDLRDPDVISPRILVVTIVPHDLQEWHLLTENELVLRRCAYWTSIEGEAETDNDYTKTVYLPKTNLFDVAALRHMIRRIGETKTL